MQAYKYDKTDGHFLEAIECQIDPRASERLGHDVYMTPADCTTVKPMKKQDGYELVFNGSSWDLIKDFKGKTYWTKKGSFWVSNVMDKYGELPDGGVLEEPEEHKQIVRDAERIKELKQKLYDTDYIVIKISEGVATKEQYARELQLREEYREEIRELENKL